VILLAATGSFNTTAHLTSFEQFWTTAYGRTLTVKITIFLFMIGVSTYHAFFLRPRLAYAIVERESHAYPTETDTNPSYPKNKVILAHKETLSPHALTLGKRLEHWLRLEATVGAIILLCVALLAAFAGSLTTPTSSNTSSQPSGPVTQTQTVNGYTITLKVTPATKQAGVYSQQADLTMAGHWEVSVRILPANANNFIDAIFHFSAS
jgi:hypothetical protein